ncbi:hypothetical protein I0E51_06075 [Pseudomonas lalucatii]|nr:hypothetical protein [Pseudomonas lalucatii]
MGLIYLALYKGRGRLFNRLIRLWTRSRYSHCELVMPDGRWLSASAMDGGVRAKRIELDLAHWDLIPCPGPTRTRSRPCSNATRARATTGSASSPANCCPWPSTTSGACSAASSAPLVSASPMPSATARPCWPTWCSASTPFPSSSSATPYRGLRNAQHA